MTPKATILLVEDEKVSALAESLALEQEGYAVLWAASGSSAVDLATTPPLPDMILMDMNLGAAMDGLETAQAILRKRDVPVVFLSSHTDRETVERSRRITSYGYVVKGTGIAVLLAAVETALELFSARKNAQESRRLYRDTVLSVREGIVVLDRELRYVVWNRFMEELTGIPAEDLLGRSALLTFPHLWAQGVEQLLTPALGGETVESGDTPFFIPSTGRRGWIKGTYAPRRDAANQITGVLGTVVDLTTRKQTEEILMQLAAIVASAQDAIIGQTPEGVVTFWNPGAEKLYGYSAEDMRGQTLLCLLPPDRTEELELLRRRILAGENITCFDTVRRARDGTLRNISLSVFPIRDSKQAIVGIASIARDMTAQRQMEQALEESQGNARALLNAPDHIMALVDRQGRILECNEALARHWKVPVESLRGKSIFQKQDRDVAALRWKMLMHCLREGQPQHLVDEHRGHFYELDGFPVLQDGEVPRVAISVRDITDRIRVQNALKETEERYRSLFENARDAIFVVDPEDGRILETNATAREELGYSREELLNLFLWDFSVDPSSDGGKRRLQDVKNSGRATFETQHRRRDGTLFPVEVRAQRIFFGNRVAVMGLSRDISERLQARQLLERSLEEKQLHLKELQHRVKNTLATILSLLSIEERRASSAEAKAGFQSTAFRVQTMAALYDKLHQTEQGSSVDLGSYLASVAHALLSSALGSRRVELRCVCPRIPLDLRRSVACGLIVNELLTNALKHAFPSGASGSLELRLASENSELELCVADDGIGLPPEAEKGRPGSSGMQLVNLLTSQLEGHMTVSREKGTAWTLNFPL